MLLKFTCDRPGHLELLRADGVVKVVGPGNRFAMITADGPKPLAVGELSPAINRSIQTIKSFERLVAEAAVTGNRDLLVAALVANPLCDSDAAANAVIDGLLEAHKAYLPQFFGQKFGA